MKVYGRNHVYRYVPNFLDNRKLPKERIAEQIVVKLKVVSSPENDNYQRESITNSRTFAPDKASELNEARFHKLFNDKFIGVEGLEIEGFEGKELDFESFYSEAPPDIVTEVSRAILSSEVLTLGEQKNFVPESDGV